MVDWDGHLKIRHGTNLILKIIVWKASEDNIDTLIIEIKVWESVECGNWSKLAASQLQ